MRSFVLSLVAFTIGSALALDVQWSGVAFGYGYGYGICTASRPSNLAATYVNNYKRIELSWDEVTFADCEDIVTASYRVQLRKPDQTLLLNLSDITNNYKRISASSLQTNHAYQFKVKAAASDGETTDWSLYKSFRTLPKKPSKLTVKQFSSSSAYVSWRNVARSSKLRYYQLVVKRGNKVMYSKRVKLGLRKVRTGTLVENLKPNIRYRVKIRAVARKTSKGLYAKEYFKLD